MSKDFWAVSTFEEELPFELWSYKKENNNISQDSSKDTEDTNSITEVPSSTETIAKANSTLNDTKEIGTLNIYDEIKKWPPKKSNILWFLNNTKYLIIWACSLSLLLIVWVVTVILGGDSKPDPQSAYTDSSDNLSLEFTEDELLEEGSFDDENIILSSATQSWELNDSPVTNSWWVEETSDPNIQINVNWNSWDETIDIIESIMGPSDVKVTLDSYGEFDGFEENSWEDASFVTVKENNLVIPTISKLNFIPNVSINVSTTQKTFSVSDLIVINYDVLLNSKTLSYTISKSTYADKDLIIDLNTNEINSDIVSIEENLIREEVTIPLTLMSKWSHTVWFKINWFPDSSYTFTIQ